MDIKEQVIDHFAEIFKYGNPKNLKELLRDNVGRFKQYESTTQFLANNQVEEIEKLSKQEKNILADALIDNACSRMIVNEYNIQLKERHIKLEDKNKLFKAIKSTSEFLKVSPYKEDNNFQQAIYTSLISFHCNDEKENKKLLKKSFNLFLDKNTIKGFLSKDSLVKKDSIKQIEQKIKIEELESKKSTIVMGIAGMTAMMLLALNNQVGEAIDKYAPKVTEYVNPHIHNAHFANIVSNFAVMGIIGWVAFEGFKKSIEICKKISENSKEERIGFTKTEEMKKNKEIGERLLHDVLYNNNKVDIQNQENKNYLDLCLYLQEKLNTPNGLKIPQDLKNSFNLNPNQIKKIQSLSIDDIHELANVANPQARVALLLNDYSPHEKAVMKQIINAKKLFELDKGPIQYFAPTEIKELGNTLENKLTQLPAKDKALVSQYLDLFVSKEGYLNHTVKTEIEYALNHNQSLVEAISNQLDIKIANKLKEPEKNEAFAYIKRTTTWFTGESKEEIVSFNSDTSDYLKKRQQDFNFSHLSNVIPEKETLKEKLDNHGSNLVRKIGSIRDKIFKTSDNNQQRPTI